jgi:hypothetical protein
MAQRKDRIRVHIEGKAYSVVGGSFQEMLAAVKNLPGRRFDSANKVWEVPGDVGVVKGMLEAAGFNLEGVENIALGPVPPMEPPDVTGSMAPPPPEAFEPPDFLDDDEVPPFEPPDWWDEGPPPYFEEESYPAELTPSPDQATAKSVPPEPLPMAEAAPTGDRIRLKLADRSLVVTGGSFQEMLAVVKKIPGRRFNPEEKVWEIPSDIGLESVQQAVNAVGFILMEESP